MIICNSTVWMEVWVSVQTRVTADSFLCVINISFKHDSITMQLSKWDSREGWWGRRHVLRWRVNFWVNVCPERAERLNLGDGLVMGILSSHSTSHKLMACATEELRPAVDLWNIHTSHQRVFVHGCVYLPKYDHLSPWMCLMERCVSAYLYVWLSECLAEFIEYVCFLTDQQKRWCHSQCHSLHA